MLFDVYQALDAHLRCQVVSKSLEMRRFAVAAFQLQPGRSYYANRTS